VTSSKNSYLVVNILYWVVAALVHPLASLLHTGSGEPPKIFSLLIPLLFVGLAFGSTVLLSRAVSQQREA
jgi:hypothetical protein